MILLPFLNIKTFTSRMCKMCIPNNNYIDNFRMPMTEISTPSEPQQGMETPVPPQPTQSLFNVASQKRDQIIFNNFM